MRWWLCLGLLALSGCYNFEALVQRCVATGHCGDAGEPGGEGGGSGGSGGSAGGGTSSMAVLRLDKTELHFGELAALTTSAAPLTVTITNDGPDATTPVLSLVGPNASEFSLSTGSMVLPANAMMAVPVTFKPNGTPGAKSATLQITALNAAGVNVMLDGTGIAALEVSTTTLAFGPTNVGSTSSLVVDVTNRTAQVLSVSYLVNPPVAFAKAVAAPCTSIASGAACSVEMAFSPPDGGNFASTLNVSAVIGTQTFNADPVSMTGAGIPRGALGLSFAVPPSNVRLDAGQVFDDVFTLSNSATNPIGPISLQLSPVGPFSILDAGCAALDGGASCQGVIRFAPTAIGEPSATLLADAGLGGIAVSALSGLVAGDFALRVSSSQLDGGLITTPDGGCAGDCTYFHRALPPTYPVVTVTAGRPTRRYGFVDWSGDCSGTDASCSVRLTANRAVTANYERVNTVFVTSTAVTAGAIGGIAGADALCQAAALDAGLSGTFVAWVSTGASNARDRLSDAGWERLDDLPFAYSKGALLAGQVLYPVTFNEHGTINSNPVVWSGTLADGTKANTCGDFASNTGTGTSGLHRGGNTEWTASASAQPCSQAGSVLCLQVSSRASIMPLPPVPKDGGTAVLFVSTSLTSATIPSDGGATIGHLDAHCTSNAQNRPFAAFVSSSTATAGSRIPPGLSGRLYRPDGVVLLDDVGTLRVTGTDLKAPPEVTYAGAHLGPSQTVIGGALSYLSTSASPAEACGDWSTPTGYVRGGQLNYPAFPFWFGGNINAVCPPSATTSAFCIGAQ